MSLGKSSVLDAFFFLAQWYFETCSPLWHTLRFSVFSGIGSGQILLSNGHCESVNYTAIIFLEALLTAIWVLHISLIELLYS
jgi:hypothetical protein